MLYGFARQSRHTLLSFSRQNENWLTSKKILQASKNSGISNPTTYKIKPRYITDNNFSAKVSTKILLAPYLTINTLVENFNRQRHTKYSDYQWTNPYSAFPTGLVFVTEPSSKVGWALSVYYYRRFYIYQFIFTEVPKPSEVKLIVS